MTSQRSAKIRQSRLKDLKQTADFLHEISTLLSKFRDLRENDLKLLAILLNDRITELENPVQKLSNKYTDNNKSKTTLVGLLPKLLQDEQIFPKNEDIAEFSLELLGIRVSRHEKRSKYELIGFIVTEVLKLDEEKMQKLVSSIVELVNDEKIKEDVINKKSKSTFSWFEYIGENS